MEMRNKKKNQSGKAFQIAAYAATVARRELLLFTALAKDFGVHIFP